MFTIELFETVLNPQNRIDDFYAKMKALQDLELDPQVDPEAVKQRKLDLKREFDKLNEDLRDWFGKGKKGGAGGGGWDRYNTKGERIGKCGDRKPGEGKPKCLSKSKAAALRAKGGKKAIANAVKRKRAKDPQTDRPGTGNKPKNVSNNINEGKIADWLKKSALATALVSALMVSPAQAGSMTDNPIKEPVPQTQEQEQQAIKDAIIIMRMINNLKGYGREGLESEMLQQFKNLLRDFQGDHPKNDKIKPIIQTMWNTDKPLPVPNVKVS